MSKEKTKKAPDLVMGLGTDNECPSGAEWVKAPFLSCRNGHRDGFSVHFNPLKNEILVLCCKCPAPTVAVWRMP